MGMFQMNGCSTLKDFVMALADENRAGISLWKKASSTKLLAANIPWTSAMTTAVSKAVAFIDYWGSQQKPMDDDLRRAMARMEKVHLKQKASEVMG